MLKKILALFVCLSILLTLSSCNQAKKSNAAVESGADAKSKVKVLVTFNAMKEFVQAVGKDHVDITTMIPDGTEPHDFEPKAKDLEKLSSANVFVYSGLGMETWAEKAIQSANNSGLISVEASKGIEPITNTDADEIKEHGQYDPHAWISLKGAETDARNIKDALVKADPSHGQDYQTNCDSFISQLESLYKEYADKFKSVSNKSFVTGHAAFAYLCRDFGLSQNSVEDVFAEGEPSAKQLVRLVEYCKENHVKTIFVEDMVSPDVSKTLASQVGASVETIFTIESSEGNKTYLERQQDNLKKIYASLTK